MTTKKPFLLTGGSGVVGTALRRVLRPDEYLALVRDRPLDGVASVRGDVRAERLGLSAAAYDDLARRIGGVVHCAADTRLNSPVEELAETNLAGTRTLMDLALRAQAPFHYVSTAFVHALERPGGAARPMPYAESKRAAEREVRELGSGYTILRPSIVAGDARTGEISEFQGLHRTCGAILQGLFPAFPAERGSLVDFVPQDLTARVIAAAARGGLPDRAEVWITAGERAITFDALVGVLTELGDEISRPFSRPRVVPLEMYERLIKPVFLPGIPPKLRHLVTGIFEHVAPYLSSPEPFPSSGALLERHGAAHDPLAVLRTTAEYWVRTTGHARTEPLSLAALMKTTTKEGTPA
ncbi:SDR family oxidoreductase [Actinocorallia populi]|uniref:SDR family oxidoreductase n=1 Tax=Actinocorallia populi TaxID=2079200 RepID=UPI000D08B7E0|nr:SDR family oxidoreductase [Actinocorallia populi]